MACTISRRLSWRLCAAVLFALLGLWPTLHPLSAQTFDATTMRSPQDMGMTWLIHSGDDMAWAQPGFDDSQWMRFDPSSSLKVLYPTSRPEIVWYRLHVKVAPGETGLALAEWNLSSAFEIYVNGQKVIETGEVKPFKPYTFDARLLARIPDAAIATGSVTIAMRAHISQLDWANSAPGFYTTNLTMGQEDALSDHMWLTVIGQNALSWFYELVGLGLGVVALALFVAQPRQREYLWIALMFCATALLMPLTFYRLFHNLPAGWGYVSAPLQIASLIFETLMFFALLRIPFGRWIQLLLVVAVVGMIVSTIGTAHGIGSWLATLLTAIPELAIIAGVIPVLLILHFRRGNREAGILLVPALLSSLSIFLYVGFFLLGQIAGLATLVLTLEQVVFNWKVGPFVVNMGAVGECLFVLSLAVIMVLRSTRISRQQGLMESELAAAREVQQIILPDQIETIPGFQIESAYQPAQQVGGDFFQILPTPDGALLLVVGDVAGKGVPAAMLVAVVVGAVRGVAEYTSDPAELLGNLNDRLIGRANGGFATALVALISANGAVTIANAGHLPPYLDGREVELPGVFPLGIEPCERYQTIHFRLEPGSRLTFYSDGIVEAQNTRGELFGFERGREISTQPVAAIVEAAKQFGQQDDMTAIAITRDRAIASAA